MLTLAQNSKTYSRLKDFLALLNILFNLIFIALMIAGGSIILFKFILRISVLRYWSVLLYGIFFMFLKSLFLLPLNFFSGYVVEHRFGLSNQNIPGWLKRTLKKTLVGSLIVILLILIFYVLLDKFSWWWPWIALAYFIFSIFLNFVLPYIACFFYKLSPISDNQLLDRLKMIFRKSKFKLEGVYKFGLSKETKKANAALVGIGRTKRILLADNLLNKFSLPEIGAVAAHELGHYQHAHIRKEIIVNGLLTLLIMYSGSIIAPKMINLFSSGDIYNLVNFPILLLFFSLVSLIAMPFTNGLSRLWEYQADSFAVRNTAKQPFINALEKLAEMGLIEKTRPAWSEIILHNHPSIAKRISAINKLC